MNVFFLILYLEVRQLVLYIRSPLIRAVGLKKAGRCKTAVSEGEKGSEKV